MAFVHGTCISFPLVETDGLCAAVLLRGPSGAGKSDLALRLIDDGAMLVADDQVEISARDDMIIVTPPETTAGLLEVRGVGLVQLPCVAEARLVGVIELVAAADIERMPAAETTDVAGHAVALWQLHAFEASAMAKIGVIVALAAGRAELAT